MTMVGLSSPPSATSWAPRDIPRNHRMITSRVESASQTAHHVSNTVPDTEYETGLEKTGSESFVQEEEVNGPGHGGAGGCIPPLCRGGGEVPDGSRPQKPQATVPFAKTRDWHVRTLSLKRGTAAWTYGGSLRTEDQRPFLRSLLGRNPETSQQV